MLCIVTPAGQRWLGGASCSPLLTFEWFHLHDIGCMQSAKWVTPAEGATIACAGLGVYVDARACLSYSRRNCCRNDKLLFKCSQNWSVTSGHGSLGCGKVPMCNPLCIRLGRPGNSHPGILHPCSVGEQPHMLAFGQTWQSTFVVVQ